MPLREAVTTPDLANTPEEKPMILRSMLFVPGDSERKLAKGESSPADALILDLEDSVAADRTAIAREMVRAYLDSRPDRSRQQLWVRINPLATPKAVPDLAAVVGGAPDGILLPKPDSAAEIVLLDNYLTALEVRDGIAPNSIRIIPVATETAKAVFALGTYAGCSKRLVGMTWGAEDLAAALGASTNKSTGGGYALTYEFARSMCLAGAVAAEVQPIDTLFVDFRDSAGLTEDSKTSRQLGFTGRIAIHPDQVVPINAAYSPTEDEVAFARRVVDAFAASPGIGVIGLDGKMLDMPHLKQANRLLAMAELMAQRAKPS
jgi:citrate lyase subunit beta/citryl-CoA lyase